MNPANTTPIPQKPKFSVAITTDGYKKLINNTLGDSERAKRFVAAITSAVAINPVLHDCDAGTILAGALLGESLNLSPSPQLGQYYLVPFECKVKGPDGKTVYLTDSDGNKLKDDHGRWIALTEKKAQFVLGYKGYIQLAIRSGQYKKLNVTEIKEGELVKFDPLNEEIECNLIEDIDAREKAQTIGYYAMFEYINGFRKAIYWTKRKVINHADQYSPAFSAIAYDKMLNGEIPEQDMWKYSSFWYKNFDDMAKKTLLRQLISKWGIMSTEIQMAFEHDTSMVTLGNNNEFVATPEERLDIAQQNYELVQPEAEQIVEKVDLSEL
jgi:recombination protein RecT